MRIAAIFALMSLIGCRPAEVGVAMKEFAGEKYARRALAGRFRIELRYLPSAYRLLAHAGLDSSRRFSGTLLDSLSQANGEQGGLAFLLRLSPADSGSEFSLDRDLVFGEGNGFAGAEEAARVFQYGLGDKIWLEAGGMKIPLLEYRMENNYGLSNGRDFVLLFRKPEELGAGKAVRTDLVMDGLLPGMVRQRFEWKFPIGINDDAT